MFQLNSAESAAHVGGEPLARISAAASVLPLRVHSGDDGDCSQFLQPVLPREEYGFFRVLPAGAGSTIFLC